MLMFHTETERKRESVRETEKVLSGLYSRKQWEEGFISFLFAKNTYSFQYDTVSVSLSHSIPYKCFFNYGNFQPCEVFGIKLF